MFLIRDKIVHEDLLREEFVCHLSHCKGACCWKGDFGAPLDEEEIITIQNLLPALREILSSESLRIIEQSGITKYYQEIGKHGTNLLPNGACVFLVFDASGVGKCGIEKLFESGQTKFKKPISCHLYPVRAEYEKPAVYESLHYDRWSICSDACTLGKELKIPLYRFVKDALVRKYGEDFYDELDEIAEAYQKEY